MSDSDRITHYIQKFLYTVSRPHFLEILSSSVDFEKIKYADTDTKLMSLGALFTSGKLDECVQLANQLDFNDVMPEERSLLSLIIFKKFYEHGFANQHFASALKHLLVAICPDALLAHKQCKEPFPRNSRIKFDYARTISSSVTGAVFFSEFRFGPGSRINEAGYRIQKALTSHGWNVSLFPTGDVQLYSSSTQSDFVIIDVLAFCQMTLVDIRNTLTRLRRYFRKIIILDVDVWAGRFNDLLRSISDHIDYIWGFTNDWCLASEPGFKGRSIFFPGFGGFDYMDNIIQADLGKETCTFNFTGSVQIYNLNRIGWLLEFIYHNLPVEINITDPEVDDGLDPMYSQQVYAQTLAGTHSAISLITRMDGSRPFTGRSFEVISLNRLLIQESCPAFHNYFEEGEHFLEFSDIDELSTIIEFLRSHPKTAQMVCFQGYQFYQKRYSSKKLVEHIQTFL